MKKSVLILAVILILTWTASALAVSPYDLDGRFIQNLQGLTRSRINWKRTIDSDGRFVTITEKASVNGANVELTIIGYTDRAYQISLTVPFNKLRMDGNAVFYDELYIYNTVFYLAMEALPMNSVPYEIFQSYDIRDSVETGMRNYSVTMRDGWEWMHREPGYLSIRRRASGTAVHVVLAHKLNNGMMWFNVEFN